MGIIRASENRPWHLSLNNSMIPVESGFCYYRENLFFVKDQPGIARYGRPPLTFWGQCSPEIAFPPEGLTQLHFDFDSDFKDTSKIDVWCIERKVGSLQFIDDGTFRALTVNVWQPAELPIPEGCDRPVRYAPEPVGGRDVSIEELRLVLGKAGQAEVRFDAEGKIR